MNTYNDFPNRADIRQWQTIATYERRQHPERFPADFPDDPVHMKVAADKLDRTVRCVRGWAADGWIRRWNWDGVVWVSQAEVVACAKNQNRKRLNANYKAGPGRGHKTAGEEVSAP